jgi:hypothetical protein
MDVRLCVHIPMHRYEVTRAGRWYARLMGNPAWCRERAEILDRYTLPSLERQTHRDFDVLITLQREQGRRNAPIKAVAKAHGCDVLVRPYMTWEYPLAPNHHAYLCARYGALDWLILLHLDSDDCYAEDVVKLLLAEPLSEGLMMWFAWGFLYSLKDGRMARFGSDTGPQPFWAEVYSRAALTDAGTLMAYRYKWRMECYHSEVARSPNNRRLTHRGRFCQLIHGANATTAWADPNTAKKVGEFLDEERKRIALRHFGITP